jgi:hypothetical protein
LASAFAAKFMPWSGGVAAMTCLQQFSDAVSLVLDRCIKRLR